MTRYKSSSENAEKVEDELKAEKRKLQREVQWVSDTAKVRSCLILQFELEIISLLCPFTSQLRSALDKVDELESNNSHLTKRLEKIKSSRGMAQTP